MNGDCTRGLCTKQQSVSFNFKVVDFHACARLRETFKLDPISCVLVCEVTGMTAEGSNINRRGGFFREKEKCRVFPVE